MANRDIGLQLAGDLAGGRFSYQAAYLNGSNDGGSSETFTDMQEHINDDKEYALRLFTQPFAESESFAIRGLGFGIAGLHRSGRQRHAGAPAAVPDAWPVDVLPLPRDGLDGDRHTGRSPTASVSASRRSSITT